MIRRFEDDLTGSADGNGNFHLSWRGMTGQFATVRLIGIALGQPNWVVNLNGAPVELGQGGLSAMVLPLLQPGDFITVDGTGTVPLSAVRMHVVGHASGDVGELTIPALGGGGGGGGATPQSALAPAPAGIQLWPLGVKPIPGQFSFQIIQPATLTSQNFNLPAGAKALRIVATVGQGGPAFTYSMVVSEAGSGTVLWPQGAAQPGVKAAPLFPARPVIIPFEAAWYASPGALQINISITGDPAASLNFWVSALFDIESVDIWSQLPLTVQEGALPPLWQAPTVIPAAVEVGAVGTATLRAGIVNQVIRVFGWEMQIDNGGAAVTGQWTGYLEGDVSLKRVGTISASAVDKQITGYHAGGPLNSGEGLRLNMVAVGANGICRALASLSQG